MIRTPMSDTLPAWPHRSPSPPSGRWRALSAASSAVFRPSSALVPVILEGIPLAGHGGLVGHEQVPPLPSCSPKTARWTRSRSWSNSASAARSAASRLLSFSSLSIGLHTSSAPHPDLAVVGGNLSSIPAITAAPAAMCCHSQVRAAAIGAKAASSVRTLGTTISLA